MESNAANIVDGGGPLGTTKRAAKSGISEARNNLTGYVIVEAESLDATARLFVDHPISRFFPATRLKLSSA